MSLRRPYSFKATIQLGTPGLISDRSSDLVSVWRQGRRKGGPWPPWILKCLAKKGCFFNFEE